MTNELKVKWPQEQGWKLLNRAEIFALAESRSGRLPRTIQEATEILERTELRLRRLSA